MKDSEIIEAVLTSCGWTYHKRYDGNCWLNKSAKLYSCEGNFYLIPPILTSLDACHAVLPMKDVAFREFVWFNIASHWDELLDMTARDWCMAYLAWLKFKGVESK